MNRHSQFEPSVQTRKILCIHERSKKNSRCRWRKPTRLENESVITTFSCDRFMEALVGCNPGEVGARERVLEEHRSANDVLGGIEHGLPSIRVSLDALGSLLGLIGVRRQDGRHLNRKCWSGGSTDLSEVGLNKIYWGN